MKIMQTCAKCGNRMWFAPKADLPKCPLCVAETAVEKSQDLLIPTAHEMEDELFKIRIREYQREAEKVAHYRSEIPLPHRPDHRNTYERMKDGHDMEEKNRRRRREEDSGMFVPLVLAASVSSSSYSCDDSPPPPAPASGPEPGTFDGGISGGGGASGEF